MTHRNVRYLAPHSPHGAALPAPWYESLQINATAPRSPSYNDSGLDHHWLIEQQKPLTLREATSLDLQFEKRWRCLRATDDLLLAMESELTTLDLWSSTYIFFTADHGYHFGELRLGPGKWNVYDTDVRVPMRIVGPGISMYSGVSMYLCIYVSMYLHIFFWMGKTREITRVKRQMLLHPLSVFRATFQCSVCGLYADVCISVNDVIHPKV